MKEFIEYLVSQIVKNPKDVSVLEINSNGITVYEIEVNQEDMGIVIGKKGRTINNIRSLVKAKAIKDGVRVQVELTDKANVTI